nr:roadblock/LC7 domain-containing protein [Candidatus Sigynarchaeota archaeon]
MSKLDDAKVILENLQTRLPDINDLAIARTNGLIIASLSRMASTDNKMERLMGGMASALFSISKRAAEELLKGEFISLTTEISTGNIFLIYTGKVILMVVTKKEPNLGLISLELEEAAKKLNVVFA